MRTKNSITNLIAAIVGQFFGLIISFIARFVFIKYLGAEYLGINGLFTNMLTLLSLVELGIGPAMSYGLYRPLAEGDTEKVKTLMNLYGKVYRVIGVLIILLGVMTLPFYRFFIGDQPAIGNLDIVYVLFILNTAASYFYSYKRTLIICDQKKYIATIYRYACYFLMNTLQVILLVITKNYLLFLIIQVLFTIIENITLSNKANKLYPYLKDKTVKKIEKTEKDAIRKNIYAMSLHKVGSIVVNSTDNILISKLVGIVEVGIYSNYFLITSAIETITSQFFNAIIASVGNLHATENGEKTERVFYSVFFLNYVIFSICSTCFFCIVNQFIEIWLGSGLTFDFATVISITICMYLKGMRRSVLTFRDAMGLFRHDRYKAIIEAIINIIASIVLGVRLGVLGIFLGTIVSTILTSVWVEPYVLFRRGFNKKTNKYYVKFVLYTIATIFTCIITFVCGNMMPVTGVFSLVVKGLFLLILSATLTLLPFVKTKEFSGIMLIIADMRHKRLK